VVKLIGPKLAQQVKDVSIKLYNFAANYAESVGIIIADTKFEFGILDGKLILIDELFTPDSSRFWLWIPIHQENPNPVLINNS